jgi:hypothetical protein
MVGKRSRIFPDSCHEAKQRTFSGLQDVCGNTTQSWQGALRPRCIPSHWRGPGIEPSPAIEPSGRFIATSGSLCAPQDPMASLLPLDPRAGDFALPAPIDQRAFRRPLETTSRAWSLPAPPAPNHGWNSSGSAGFARPDDSATTKPKMRPAILLPPNRWM